MHTKDYDQIIKEISDKIAKAFMTKERDLNDRILSMDADIAKITQAIGQEVTEQIIKEFWTSTWLKKTARSGNQAADSDSIQCDLWSDLDQVTLSVALGRWIQALMQFILDKTHLKDHFYETAEQLSIPAADRSPWVHADVDRISDGQVDSVINELETSHASNANERLGRLIGYLRRFRDAVDYNRFKAKGYPIGSGEVESAHRSIPQKRMKIAGACWHLRSINPMLALRVLRANGWWDHFWQQQTLLRKAA